MEMNDCAETIQKRGDVSERTSSSYYDVSDRAFASATDEQRKSLKDYLKAGGSLCGVGETLDIREFIRSFTAKRNMAENKRKSKLVEVKRRRTAAPLGKIMTREFPFHHIPSFDLPFEAIEGIDYYDTKTYHSERIRGERIRTVLKRDRKLNARMMAARERAQLEKEKEAAAAALILNEVKKPLQKRSLVSITHEKDSFMRKYSSRAGSRLGSISKFSSLVGSPFVKGNGGSTAFSFKVDDGGSGAEFEFSPDHILAFTKRFEPDYDTLDIKLFKVRLQETETINLYAYESVVADVNSDLGAFYKLQRERAAAQSLEDAPEMHDKSTQIMASSRMDRAHQIPELSLVSVETNVCYSQILDSMAAETEKEQVTPPPLSDDSSSSHGESDEAEESKWETLLLTSPEFQRTYDRMLRTIDSLHYNRKQLNFRDNMLIHPLVTSAEFSYEIQCLWMFKSEKLLAKNLKVVSLCWNPININVLAVGYAGNEVNIGYVCVWNVKHISKYDRSFKFKSRVTYIEFSTEYPSLLAVAFESGGIAVVNISWKRLFVVNSKPGHIFSGCLPVWQFSWMIVESGEEVPITCGENGFMYQLRKDVTFAHSQLLVLTHKHKETKGMERSDPNEPLRTERPGITCMARHPTDPVSYLAGTTDGCVHICSTNFRNQHLDAFVAHSGSVRGIKFHPHLERLFLTFGDDPFVRVWVFGVFQPVFEFSSRPDHIRSAVWSPANAEILISVSGVYLDVWDMRRDLPHPVRTWENPKGLANMRVIFDRGGNNVTVGDEAGNVIVSGLKCMPFSHLRPRDAAARAIEKVLVSKGELDMLQKLRNIGPPFGSEEDEQFDAINGEEEEEVD